MTAKFTGQPEGSLPQLSGGLLWLYRAIWCALAGGSVIAVSALPFGTSFETAILALRVSKALLLILIAAILAYRRPRDPVAALLALTLLTWTITSSFDFTSGELLPQILDRCRFLLFVVTLALFPEGRWQPRWTRHLAGTSVAVFLLGIIEATGAIATRLFLPLAILCVLAATASLISRFRQATSFALRQQLKWVALGLVSGIALILAARAGAALAAAPMMTLLWEALFQLGVMAIALGFLVSLTRYRLFDAETVISRSAAYATLTIALVATFGGTEALIENLGQFYLGSGIGNISGAMAAAVAAVLLNPLHGRITSWAEQRFQPDLALLRQELPELLARASAGGSLRGIGETILPRIATAIHVTCCVILIGGRVAAATGIELARVRQWQRRSRNGGDPLFPLRLPMGLTPSGDEAWLLLGMRPDGSLPGKEDLDAVRSALPQLRQAIANSLAREALDRAISRREQTLRDEILELGNRLSAVEQGSRSHLPTAASS